MDRTDGSTIDFERSLAECMRSLVPDFEDDPAAERLGHAEPDSVVIELHRPQRHRNRPLLLVTAVGLAAAAAAVVLLVTPGDRDRTQPAGPPASKHTTAPAAPCGAGLSLTSGRFPAEASPTVSLSLRNTGAACSLRAMPRVTIDSDGQGESHLAVPPDASASRLPATIPAHGTATFRIEFVRVSDSGATPAHLTVTVGSAPALRTPLRKTESFGVAAKALVFIGVTKG